MPRIICSKCNLQMSVVRVGVYVVDMFLDPPQPYRIYSGDLYKCTGCDTEMVSGLAANPIATHHEDKFEEVLKDINENGIVVRCYENVRDSRKARKTRAASVLHEFMKLVEDEDDN